mmetsp:Transcript_26907/g.48927  ORF Transcript_26907/g.48927 Transcript_26907/m.48927 type:complete len:85 (-) Transcript_26907:491-745(-)
MKVGDGVVSVVLVLPPLHGITLHKISPEDSDHVTVLALAENLVVKEVMSEPSALLPEKSKKESGSNVHGDGVRERNHGDGSEPH